MLLGLAWQRGLIPVGEAAIRRAIELNGAAVADQPAGVSVGPHRWRRGPRLIGQRLTGTIAPPPATLEALIESRVAVAGGVSERAATPRAIASWSRR